MEHTTDGPLRSDDLAELRRRLHQHAEPSGGESATVALVERLLEGCRPDRLVTGLGGHGLAAVFCGTSVGPRVMLRCELDALPIPETPGLAHGSKTPGYSHRCGHDGHMALLLGLAGNLQDVERGEVVLLFQPAEETGEGARRVLQDPRLDDLAPDLVFALHNLPGHPAGLVVVRGGAFASASRGLVVELQGVPAHASEPHNGRSPAAAVARLISGIEALPQRCAALDQGAQATVVCARLGEEAFGTAPGSATVMATLRAHRQAVLERLWEEAAALGRRLAVADGLAVKVRPAEDFPATSNHPAAAALVAAAAEEAGLTVEQRQAPFPWSEDFGHFTGRFPGALFGLGAGVDTPHLHSDRYDFPDGLLPTGLTLLRALVGRALHANP